MFRVLFTRIARNERRPGCDVLVVQRDRRANIFKYYIKILFCVFNVIVFSSFHPLRKSGIFASLQSVVAMFTGNALKLLFCIFKIPRKKAARKKKTKEHFKGFDRSEAIPNKFTARYSGLKLTPRIRLVIKSIGI